MFDLVCFFTSYKEANMYLFVRQNGIKNPTNPATSKLSALLQQNCTLLASLGCLFKAI
jgi:hypothetical protein